MSQIWWWWSQQLQYRTPHCYCSHRSPRGTEVTVIWIHSHLEIYHRMVRQLQVFLLGVTFTWPDKASKSQGSKVLWEKISCTEVKWRMSWYCRLWTVFKSRWGKSSARIFTAWPTGFPIWHHIAIISKLSACSEIKNTEKQEEHEGNCLFLSSP